MKKRTVLLVILIFIFMVAFNINAFAFTGKGSGTTANPYQISNSVQLKEISNDLKASYRLVADIDLQNIDWVPFGTEALPFKGTLDGAGYKIKNLKITRDSAADIGLFGYTDGAEVKNVRLENINVIGYENVGPLIGYAANTSIDSCFVSGTGAVTGDASIGGLIGLNSLGKVMNSGAAISVNSTGCGTGGLIGFNTGDVDKCYAVGDVSGSSSEIGGLIGIFETESETDAKVLESYATGNVKGSSDAGGLIGNVCSGSGSILIENCFALGSVTSRLNSGACGLIGYMSSYDALNITNCYSIGKVGVNGNGLIQMKSGIVTSSYFNSTNTLLTVPEAQARTTQQLTHKETFIDWDFASIWTVEENKTYPFLKNLPKPEGVIISVSENFMGGTGTAADPFLISTATQLQIMAHNLDLSYKLINDIDLNNTGFIPIGSKSAPFKGNFDGAGHKIKNLKISKADMDYVGLFGYTEGAKIKNINIENITVTGRYYVGGLNGYALNTVTDNCSTSGSGIITGIHEVGGLIGRNGLGTVRYSSSSVAVSSADGSAGGLAGVSSGDIDKCYTTGDVTSTGEYTGGLIGHLMSESRTTLTVTESYSTGKVTGTSYVGGLVGYEFAYNQDVWVENCFALGSVTSTINSPFAGGLVGYMYSTDLESAGAYIYSNYSVGKVSSGGSGLVGMDENELTNQLGYVYHNYYDGMTSQIISDNPYNPSRLTSLMTKAANYTGWDFSTIWTIEEGVTYPYLKNLPKPNGVTTTVAEGFAGGSGTDADPFLISNAVQLRNVVHNLDSSYKLINDIDLSNIEFTPIGSETMSFKRTFDGAGYKIRNLKLTRASASNVGLFGYTDSAVIKNIYIENVSISGEYRVGGLIGDAHKTTIDNCSVSGNGIITGTQAVGGLIGQTDSGIVKNSDSSIFVSSTQGYTGGLVGINGCRIDKCYATGNVNSTSHFVGGLVGLFSAETGGPELEITESYSTGNVVGTSKIGGLIGASNAYFRDSTVMNCFASGSVTSTTNSSYTGGLIGSVDYDNSKAPYLAYCYSIGKVSEGGQGLVGVYRGSYSFTYFDALKTQVYSDQYKALRTTGAMVKAANYINWDFDSVWTIEENTSYPYLKNLPKPEGVNVTELPISAVTGIVCDSKTNTSLSLTWQRTPNTETYDISINDNIVKTVSGTQVYIDDLQSRTFYDIKVRGCNFITEGEWSEAFSVQTLPDVGPVNDLICTHKTDKTITLNWKEATEATKYVIIYNGQTVETASTSITLIGLDQNTNYNIQVKGKLDLVEGPPSDIIVVKTFITPIGSVGNIISTAQTDKTITISWTAATGATKYVVMYNDQTIETASTSITLSGLDQNTNYNIQVKGKNDLIEGPLSDIIVIKTLVTPVGPIKNLISTAQTDKTITLSWTAATEATKYVIIYNGQTTETVSTSITLNGLDQYTNYNIQVKGKNDLVEGPLSYTIVLRTLITPIGPVNNIVTTAKTDVTMALSWTEVEGATQYIVYYDGKSVETTTNNIVLRDLTPNTRYFILIKGKNPLTTGSLSPGVNVTTNLPKTMGLKSTNITSTSIDLTWTAVTGATSYEVVFNGITITTKGTSTNLNGLLPETDYVVTVRAKNTVVYGDYSDEVKITTDKAFTGNAEFKINGNTGQEYIFVLTAKDIGSFSGKVFTLKYDPARLELKDFAAQTKNAAISVGKIEGTDIEIISISNGEVKFKLNKAVTVGQKWSGILTVIKFNVKTTGEIVIQLEHSL